MFSWRLFVTSKQRKSLNAMGMSSSMLWLQAGKLLLSVFLNTFRNFNGSLNQRLMSPAAQTITTEWTAEKCLDKRVQSKQASKHKLGNRAKRWSKVHADTRCPSSKKQFQQPRQQRQRQRRLNTWEFRCFQFVYTVGNIPNRICKRVSEFEKETLKIGRRKVHVLSNMQNVAFSRFLWPFVNNGK